MTAADRTDPEAVASIAELAVARARRRIAEQGPPAHLVAHEQRMAVRLADDLTDDTPVRYTPPSVPVRYRTPLDQLEQTTAVKTATAWLRRWEAGERGRGLLLVGPVGTGKSAIAGALALTVGAPSQAQFWPVPDLLAAMQDEIRGAVQPQVRHRIDRRPLLVLDDLGAERPTDWTTGVLATLVSARYDAADTLIVSTNLTPTELEDHLGERAVSRLVEMTDLVEVRGADRRKNRGGA